MIDLHAHVLPGIDDGPANLEESLQLLKVMQDQGVTQVVAAAHALDGRYNATREAVLRATDTVNEALQRSGMVISVMPGMELFLGFDLLRAVKTGQVLGLNGSHYLVVELPHREVPLYAERALFELMIAGYRPILNHPERNHELRRKPELLRRWTEQGVGAMITAASLTGRFGPEAQRAGQAYIREGLATLVVSDAHDLEGRAPLLPDGLAAARDCGKRDQSAERSMIS